MLKIYLAGLIQKEVINQCTSWRREIREYYNNWKGQGKYPLVFLDPCNGEVEDGGVELRDEKMPDNAIVHKDIVCLEKCDIVIANLNSFGISRPPIGTLSEIAISWKMNKPVIIITNDPVYINHPFLKYFSSWFVSSVQELLDKKIINQFYKAFNTAQY